MTAAYPPGARNKPKLVFRAIVSCDFEGDTALYDRYSAHSNSPDFDSEFLGTADEAAESIADKSLVAQRPSAAITPVSIVEGHSERSHFPSSVPMTSHSACSAPFRHSRAQYVHVLGFSSQTWFSGGADISGDNSGDGCSVEASGTYFRAPSSNIPNYRTVESDFA